MREDFFVSRSRRRGCPTSTITKTNRSSWAQMCAYDENGPRKGHTDAVLSRRKIKTHTKKGRACGASNRTTTTPGEHETNGKVSTQKPPPTPQTNAEETAQSASLPRAGRSVGYVGAFMESPSPKSPNRSSRAAWTSPPVAERARRLAGSFAMPMSRSCCS